LGSQKAKAVYQLTLENHRLLKEEIIDSHKIDCDYRRNGSYFLACSQHEFEEIKKSAQLLNEAGFRAKLIEKEKISKLLKTNSFWGACLIPDSGEMDPGKLVKGIAAVSNLKNKIYEQNEVTHIRLNKKFEVEIRTDKNLFVSKMAVLATNAYSPLLDDFFEDKVFPIRGQMLATEPVNHPFFDGRIVSADHGYEYFRQLRNGRIVIGGFREKYADKEMGYSDETTKEVQQGLYDFLTTSFPELKGVKVSHRWAGIMGFSRDGLPIIGALPTNPPVIASVGFTGHGMGYGFVLGKLLAQYMVESRSSYPLEIFSIRRFI
jgi:glycine/D-amino acid oxidase-like deaminating enzyme